MSNIYITGHRNPDMDSLCSAIGYAALKSLIDPANNYIPVHCSHLGDVTKRLLTSLDITPPPYMNNVYPKVSDVMMVTDDMIDASMTLAEYAKTFKATNPSAMPVFDSGSFLGLISTDSIVGWIMKELNGNGTVTGGTKLRDIVLPVTKIFQTTDMFEEAKSFFQTYMGRGVPVFENDKYAGFITRRCLMNTPRYNVILVDHNEQSQSIKGLETANIVEIIDHHRLNALKTDMPLFIDAEPLGSTCTIVYQLYLRNGIRPDRQTARILLTGILSDTLILKSPTTTPTDIESARFLAAICNLDLQEYGMSIFSNIEGLRTRDPESSIKTDFKTYNENDMRIGIGQCEVTTFADLGSYSADYLNALESVRSKSGLDWALLMITNITSEHSILLSTACNAEKHLLYSRTSEHIYDMPGVMSRKKQLLPEIMHAISI